MAKRVTKKERQANIEKLRELIKDIDFAMLSTVDDKENIIRSRPMSTQQVEFDGDLWFFTRADTPKAKEIQQDHQVNVSYAAPDKHRYVSVSGVGMIVQDRAKMEELWNPIYKIWFPDGLDEPNLALLKVEVHEAEYWEAPSGPAGTVATVIGFIQGLVKGEEADVGENEKLKLR